MSAEAEEFVNFCFHLIALTFVWVAGLLIVSGLTMLAWNWSMPYLFALPDAAYKHAVGVTLLAWALRLCSVTRSKEG